MPELKLTYFNAKGRAEISRLILAHAGVKYTDERLEGGDWAKMKPTTPWGSVPLLTIDGKRLGQSIAIARYLARENGLAGSNSLEMAHADEIVDVFVDLQTALYKVIFGNADKKEAAMKVYMEETVAPVLAKVEAVFGREKFLAGSCLTWADLEAFRFCTNMMEKNPNLLDMTPKLGKLVKCVGELPNIKKWMEERPKTAM